MKLKKIKGFAEFLLGDMVTFFSYVSYATILFVLDEASINFCVKMFQAQRKFVFSTGNLMKSEVLQLISQEYLTNVLWS